MERTYADAPEQLGATCGPVGRATRPSTVSGSGSGPLKPAAQKHDNLVEAMARLTQIRVSLGGLLARVAGEESAAKEAIDRPGLHSLMHVLDGGPGYIHEELDRMEAMIDKIKDCIF